MSTSAVYAMLALASAGQPSALALEERHNGAVQLSQHLLEWTMTAQPERNVMISAWSVQQAVGMLRLGARGETDRELAKFLGVTGSAADAAKANQRHQEANAKLAEKGVLTGANGIWVRDGETIEDDFVQAAGDFYGASIEATEFPHPGVGRINTFVSQNTNGMIDELFRTLPASTLLVLVNAVAFKDDWSVPFDPSLTAPQPFHGPGGIKSTPMMTRTGYVEVRSAGDSVQVRLRYASGMSMVLAMPAQGKPLSGMHASGAWLDPKQEWDSERVELWLPKWKSETEIDLKKAMSELGVKHVFDGARADLSGIQQPRGLFVSEAVHKAVIEVDEKGTEAAAATGIAMTRSAAPSQPARIAFDRPFLYAITLPDGTPVFTGVVQRP